MEDTNNSFFSKFQIEKEIRARRKKANIGEEEARMEIAGCTGKKQALLQAEEESYHGRTSFFLLRYFYFLNGGYFRYFIELLGAPTILLGAPSNNPTFIVNPTMEEPNFVKLS